jgi:X-X-X-Leu-X-X-Gly heptad repeat protein
VSPTTEGTLMGMAEIRDAFEAYASGELAEYELRNALRTAVYKEPETVPRYVSMASALRRRNLISAELEAAVIADMQALAGRPLSEDLTRARTGAADTDSDSDADPDLGPEPPQSAPGATGSRSGRNTGPGSAWDSKDKLNETEAPVAVGLVLRERFELIEELGRGGMGVVYKAIDQREIENRGREPHVAIKVLSEDFKRHPESARALQRESKKAMRLAHPNIVLVRDFDRDRGNVYMVMELLNGQPLDQFLLQQYPRGMPIEMVIGIVSGLGAALSYAHQQGIVHADFKPSNAFLTTQSVVKVLDFGVARAALALDRGESTLFDAGKLNAVSPAYASVELLTGGSPDARDDIYALACVTYFLLTARHPFNGIDAVKARDAGLQPPIIRGIADHQWQALRAALVFERWERTATVRDFVAQFCTNRTSRVTKIASGATKLADGATKLATEATKRATEATKRASTVVRKPSFLAVSAGALLAAAIALLVAREWTLHRSSEKASTSAPALASVAAARPSTEVPVEVVPAPVAAIQRPTEPLGVEPVPVEPERAQAEPPKPQPDSAPVKGPNPGDAVAKLKEQMSQQVEAGDIDGAAKTGAALRSAAVGSAYASNEFQQQLVQSYVQLAKKQLLDGNPAMALQTIAAGRKKFANAQELKSLEVTYDRVAEEIARIYMAPSLSVRDHQAWLDEIRQLSGDDFPGVEQMLARTLANDIADQRSRGDRPSVVSSLLESGRKLFPEQQALLEHGTAGVQDPDQMVVAGEPPAPGDHAPTAKQ